MVMLNLTYLPWHSNKDNNWRNFMEWFLFYSIKSTSQVKLCLQQGFYFSTWKFSKSVLESRILFCRRSFIWSHFLITMEKKKYILQVLFVNFAFIWALLDPQTHWGIQFITINILVSITTQIQDPSFMILQIWETAKVSFVIFVEVQYTILTLE